MIKTIILLRIKLIKNFVLENKLSSFLFSILLTSFGFELRFNVYNGNDASHLSLISKTILFSILISILSFFNKNMLFNDENFLRINLSKKEFSKVILYEAIIHSFLVYIFFSMFLMGIIKLKFFFIGLFFLILPILFVYFVKNFIKENIINLGIKSGNADSKAVIRLMSKTSNSVSAILMIVFLRIIRNKKIEIAIYSLILLLSNVFIFAVVKNNNLQNSEYLFCMPLSVFAIYLLEFNSEIFNELSYFGNLKLQIFVADIVINIVLTFLYFVLLLALIMLSGFFVTKIIVIGCIFFIFICYVSVCKILFLENSILRTIWLTLTLILPILIPFSIYKIIKKVRYD